MNGFASDQPIDVDGVKISPLRVLMKLVKPPVDTFFLEDEEFLKAPLKVLSGLAIEVDGASGEEIVYSVVTLPVSLFSNVEERLMFYRKFGASNIYVALPAVVGAKMSVEGSAARGVMPAECLDPQHFFAKMAALGVPLQFREIEERHKHFV
jgi:saccharopine dehydrogenase-like NADP-dependent oxidoreductase